MNVLLTSVGRRSYLVSYFREALRGRGRVIVTNTHADTSGMNEADVAIIVPPSQDPSYINVIEDICRDYDVGMLCSLHDIDVFVLAQHRNRLVGAGVIPILPDPEWARICLDKYECGLKLRESGLEVPWTSISLEETMEALDKNLVRLPLMMKPRMGFGSLRQHPCRSLAELEVLHRQICDELERSIVHQFLPGLSDTSVLIQEFIDGKEYRLNLVNDLEGQYATHFACEVHAMRAGESDVATTVDPDFFGDIPIRLSQLTRHPGIFGIDIMRHGGVPKIIDINPRFTGEYPFMHLAGANIPAALLAWAWGEEPESEWLKPEVGIRGYKKLVPVRVIEPIATSFELTKLPGESAVRKC